MQKESVTALLALVSDGRRGGKPAAQPTAKPATKPSMSAPAKRAESAHVHPGSNGHAVNRGQGKLTFPPLETPGTNGHTNGNGDHFAA